MIWLTWRQFRGAAAMMAAALAALAAVLALTGPGLADDYAAGVAACTAQGGGCSDFLNGFANDNHDPFLAVTAVVLVLPALVGLFWGAPLISRELEAGTHRLVWNQSVPRSRWLAIKLGLVGLATVTVAGLGSLAVDWWSTPIDKAAADYGRMEPLLFAARGIVPIGYAVFAFALGVTVGMLVRRALPAMAITLAVFVAVQIVMPLLVRPHLVAPVRSTIEITTASLDQLAMSRDDGPVTVRLQPPETGAYAGAWVLSSQAVDASGDAIEAISVPRTGACGPGEGAAPTGTEPGDELAPCFAEMTRLGYRQQLTYQPATRFWRFQAYETVLFLGLALGLAGFCSWWLRRRLA
jgi:ABC-type transport system involved in multi-copper enzyme maturation permease subunit